jgi:hypothetical protein
MGVVPWGASAPHGFLCVDESFLIFAFGTPNTATCRQYESFNYQIACMGVVSHWLSNVNYQLWLFVDVYVCCEVMTASAQHEFRGAG